MNTYPILLWDRTATRKFYWIIAVISVTWSRSDKWQARAFYLIAWSSDSTSLAWIYWIRDVSVIFLAGRDWGELRI